MSIVSYIDLSQPIQKLTIMGAYLYNEFVKIKEPFDAFFFPGLAEYIKLTNNEMHFIKKACALCTDREDFYVLILIRPEGESLATAKGYTINGANLRPLTREEMEDLYDSIEPEDLDEYEDKDLCFLLPTDWI